jgi:hypothetical protein
MRFNIAHVATLLGFTTKKVDLVQFLDTRLGACADEVKLDAQCFARCLI